MLASQVSAFECQTKILIGRFCYAETCFDFSSSSSSFNSSTKALLEFRIIFIPWAIAAFLGDFLKYLSMVGISEI